MKRISRILGVWLLVALASSVAPAAVFAQQASPAPAGQQPSMPSMQSNDEFAPVKDLPQQEKLPAAPLLTAAYAFVWVALLAYVWTIWRRLNAVETEMRQLSDRIAERPAPRQ